jgi:hypothetical protein
MFGIGQNLPIKTLTFIAGTHFKPMIPIIVDEIKHPNAQQRKKSEDLPLRLLGYFPCKPIVSTPHCPACHLKAVTRTMMSCPPLTSMCSRTMQKG